MKYEIFESFGHIFLTRKYTLVSLVKTYKQMFFCSLKFVAFWLIEKVLISSSWNWVKILSYVATDNSTKCVEQKMPQPNFWYWFSIFGHIGCSGKVFSCFHGHFFRYCCVWTKTLQKISFISFLFSLFWGVIIGYPSWFEFRV